MRRSVAPLAAFAICGCAYFNGVYNAKSSARAGDKSYRQGEQYSAQIAFKRSAVTAETVLARHPKSRWRPEALYLAGRGFALADDCGAGMRRLTQFLALPNQPAGQRDRAEIARAACVFGAGQLAPAADMLAPLLENTDPAVRSEAALWAGRVALQRGDIDRAQALLATAPGSAAVWEFMKAAFARNDFATAESLLVSRARNGDWRSEVPQHVDVLWNAGRAQAAIGIVDVYGRSRAPIPERIGLHFLASDLSARAGDTAQSRRQAIAAQGLGVAATVDAEARVRLLALRVRELSNLADVDAAIARDSARARGTTLMPRIRDHVTRMKLFLGGQNAGGVGVFLAAEIARDSLRAYRLAHAMFRSLEDDYGDFTLAARALAAARGVMPESASVYNARVLAKWPRSGAATSLTSVYDQLRDSLIRSGTPETDADSLAVTRLPYGATIAARRNFLRDSLLRAGRDEQQIEAAVMANDISTSSQRSEDLALTRAWEFVARQWDDTLKARKTADSLAALQGGVRRQ